MPLKGSKSFFLRIAQVKSINSILSQKYSIWLLSRNIKMKQILIVEDQKSPVKALEDAVDSVMPRYIPSYSSQNRETVRCYSEARDKLANKEYLIVLLDHRMPIQNTGNLEKENFDLFSAQLANIGYSL